MSLYRLEMRPISEVIGELILERSTGQLTIVSRNERKDLYWSQGDLVLATSNEPDDSFAEFLIRRELIDVAAASEIVPTEPSDIAEVVFASDVIEDSSKQTLLRDWTAEIVRPIFSLDEGTSAFEDKEALPPEKRVFIPSTAAMILDGIRSISNGLILRNALGDPQRPIRRSREPRFLLERLPLQKDEARVARELDAPMSIDDLLKKFPGESALAARTVIAMMSLGMFELHTEEKRIRTSDIDESERELELMIAIGPSDSRSLRAVGFAKQSALIDYYHLFDIVRGATRSQIKEHYEILRKEYDPATYPPVVRDVLQDLMARLNEAHDILTTPALKSDYDRLLAEGHGDDHEFIHRMIVRRRIAEENYARARDEATTGDYHSAIERLRQTVRYVPDHADAWLLLGECQRQNPRWQRHAMDSLQRVIAIDPNNIDAIMGLGDLYRESGLIARARTCYEDTLAIDPDYGEAAVRLKTLNK